MTETSAAAVADAPDEVPRGRLRTTGAAIADVLRRAPFSIAFAVLLIVTAALTGTVAGVASEVTQVAWAADAWNTFAYGRLWTLLSALVIPWDPFQLLASVVAAVLLLGVAERVMGSLRTAISLVVTGVVGIGVGMVVQGLGSQIGEWWATRTGVDLILDPLTGILGALITSTAFMTVLWRRRVRVTAFAFVLMFVLYDGDSSNTYRLLAMVTGLFLGAMLSGSSLGLHATKPSHRETRTLLATVVAVTAIGPIVSLVNGSENTPFALTAQLFREGIPDPAEVAAQCEGVASASCLRELALVSAEGPGMFLLVFLPVVLQLLEAFGLRLGRRFALVLAVTLKIALALLSWFSFDVALTISEGASPGDVFLVGEVIVWTLAAVLLPVSIAVLLLVNRRFFAIRAPHEAVVRFTSIVGLAFIVLAGLYFIVGLVNLGEYVPDANVGDLLVDAVKRFIPVQFVATLDPIVVPYHDLTFVLYQAVGPLFWIVFVVASVPLLTAVADRSTLIGRTKLLRLLAEGRGGSLGYMGTWPGNTRWFSDDGEAAVAYRVINSVAITMSDPACAPARDERTIREFAAFCDANSWTPVFYSFHDRYVPVFDRLGWQRMSVGEETLVPTTNFELTGKPWQKVRQALNRGVKEGLTTVWTSWDELPLATIAEITAISEAWVSEKALPEMGFTLGGMDELKDPEVRLMLAVGPDGRLQAVTSWLPFWEPGRAEPSGWTLDFMRRADGSMSGVMEFVLASSALHMKETGAKWMSLSGAPLAAKPLAPGEEPPETTVMTRLLDWLGRTLEPAYGFSSLFKFKAKFNPEYQTIWMAYPDPLALPAIGVAIGRAYVPDVSPKEAVALVRTLTRE